MSTRPSLSARDMDRSVRPQDDFYQYANGGWLKRNSIPKEEARWGTFMTLRRDVDLQLHAIVRELLSKKRAGKGSPEQLIGDLFRSGMDEKRRSTLGAAPLDSFRKKIAVVASKEDLQQVLTELHEVGVGAIFGTGVGQDDKNTDQYALFLVQDGLGMPDRDYYLNDDQESKRVRGKYVPHMEAILRLAGYGKAEAARRASLIMNIETALAKAWMNKVDRRDADKIYNKLSLPALQKLAPALDWKRYLKDIGAAEAPALVVLQPKFFSAVSTLLRTVALDDWKAYFEWHLVNDFAGVLSPAFERENFAFYGTVLSGTKHMKPLWRRILGVVNAGLGEALGQIYVKRHFSPRAKRVMNELVNDLFDAYEARIKALDWMGPSTKKKALKKLRSMVHKIGYPDRWKSYRGLSISSDDFVGNIMRSARFEHRREMKKLGKPIDRTEWFMYPQTVNAYFHPTMNDIVFPAAILQPPFFDPEGDPAVNYGCIGAVIGHEMTHGFDDQGAKYDHQGNLKTWWTPADKKRFEAKTRMLVKQFDKYTVADGLHVNGKLTLGENVADLGGLVIALDAYRAHLKRHPGDARGVLDPLERFFLGFALFERELARPEFEKMHTLNDPHSPGRYRINGPVSNCDDFYGSYGVSKGDALFRASKDRARIW